MADALQPVDVVRVSGANRAAAEDRAATEEPLEVRLHGQSFAVIMRTPGADEELAAGFLFSERVVRFADELGAIQHCKVPGADHLGNVVNVTLIPEAAARVESALAERRRVTTNSSCGLCGRLTIESLTTDLAALQDDVRVAATVVATLPDRLRGAQRVFDATGGLHAAGLFAPAGRLQMSAEDVGRHNAVDKVVGRMLMNDALPLTGTILFVSGRTSFEIVQKAFLAGIPVVASVSAPSSLRHRSGSGRVDHARRIRARIQLQHLHPSRSDHLEVAMLFGLGAAEAASLSRDGTRRVGEPRSAAVRLAHPARRRLRRLRARHVGPVRLDDPGRRTVHGAARADAPEHRAGARPANPVGRRVASIAELARSCASSAACPSRCCGVAASRVSGRHAGTKRSIASPRALARRRPGPGGVLPDLARHHQRGLLRGPEGRAVSRHPPRGQLGAAVPRRVHGRDEGDARLRRVDLQLSRLAARRSDRALRIERRQQPAGRR